MDKIAEQDARITKLEKIEDERTQALLIGRIVISYIIAHPELNKLTKTQIQSHIEKYMRYSDPILTHIVNNWCGY